MHRFLNRVAARYLARQRVAGLFDFPGALHGAIVDWANDQFERMDLDKPWKKIERKFPLTLDLLGDWRYLDRMKQMPEALGKVLRRWSPLLVVFKNDRKKAALGAAGAWTRAGIKLTLYVDQYPDGAQWSRTLSHELRHFAQDFMKAVLSDAGHEAKPGYPSESLQDDVQQKAQGRIVDQLRSHALDDSEFYTKLGSEIDYWLNLEDNEEYQKLPPDVKLSAAKWYTGIEKRPAPGVPQWMLRELTPMTLTSLFRRLREDNPRKWGKAVTEFFKLVP